MEEKKHKNTTISKNMVKRLLIDTNRIVFKENQRSPCENKPPLLPRLPPNSCNVNKQDSQIFDKKILQKR